MIKLSTTSFKWSTSEQVYPFQLADDGSPLYCKQIDMGLVPNAGIKQLSHGIPSLDLTKIFHISGSANSSSSEGSLAVNHTQWDSTYSVVVRLVGTTIIEVQAQQAHWYNNNYYVKARLVYGK